MRRRSLAAAALLALLAAAPATAVREPALIPHDHYQAAGDLDLQAEVLGDLAIAGAWLRFDGRVAGDLMAAAGRAELHGRYEDDVRAAGAFLRLHGSVADEAALAGIDVTIGPGAEIGGRTSIAAERVRVEGRVRGELRITAREAVLAGTVDGPVHVHADSLRVLPGARVAGDVIYRAPEPATIEPGARVDGALTHHRAPAPGPAADAEHGDGGRTTAGVLLQVLALLVPGLLLRLGVPRFLSDGQATLAREPLLSLGIGGLLLIVGPLVALGLCLFVITIPLSVAALLLAAPLALTGYLVTAGMLAERAVARVAPGRAGRFATHALGLAAVLLALTLLQTLPIVGILVAAGATLCGTGAGSIAVHRRLRAGQGASAA